VVGGWCKLRSGEYVLPESRQLVSFCSGYDLLERAVKLANISNEYRGANLRGYSFDGLSKSIEFMIRNVLERPVDMVRKGANVLIQHNGKGTGKTFTANAILNEFIYQTCTEPEWFDYERPVAYYQKFGLWAQLNRNSFSDDEEKAKALRLQKIMMEVPLLVVDDIGGRMTPMVRDLFYDIVDYRKESQKSTVYTTNLSTDQLEKDDALGEMIVSRMLYKSVIIPLGGRDRRRT
jgi:DNA replication protein DnaC